MNERFRGDADRLLSSLRWQREDAARVLSAVKGATPPMKPKLRVALIAALILVLIAAIALAAVTLTRSPAASALQTARRALAQQRGMTQEMVRLFDTDYAPKDERNTFVFRTMPSAFVDPDKVGEYTVTLRKDGGADVAWSHDGDPRATGDGDLTAPVWGVSQLSEMLRRYRFYVQWHIDNETIYTLPLAEQEARFAELYAYVAPLKLPEGPVDPDAANGRAASGSETRRERPADDPARDRAVETAKNALAERVGQREAVDHLFVADAAQDADGFTVRLAYAFDGGSLRHNAPGTDWRWSRELAERLGVYAVRTDAAGDAALSLDWSLAPDAGDASYTESTWGQAAAYSARMLPWVCDLLNACQPIIALHPDDQVEWFTLAEAAAYHQLFRDAGFPAARYKCALPKAGDVTEEQARAIAHAAMMDEYGVSEEELAAYVVRCEYWLDDGGKWAVGYYGSEGMGCVMVRARDGEVQLVVLDSGATSNG